MADAAEKRIRKGIRKTLRAYLKNLSTTETPPSKKQLEKLYLPDVDPDFVNAVQIFITTALLLGKDHATRKLNMADEIIPELTFEQAALFMRSRIPVTKREWNALEPKLRFRAFTVARLAQLDFIDTARQVLSNAMTSGKGVAETFKQWRTLQTLVDKDAMSLRPGYWENVFRTNTQTAYTAGKLMQYQNNPPAAWRLLIVDDDRTSDICQGLVEKGKDTLTLVSDHPFWEAFGYPPYHFQCRTGLQAVSQTEIDAGEQIDNTDMKTLRGRFKPMDGFGGNPLDRESWWSLTDGMAKRAAKYGIDGDIILMAKKLGMNNYAMQMLSGFRTLNKFSSGGYVKKAALANPGKQNVRRKNSWLETDELGAARRAAQAGHKVYFLPHSKIKGVSSPDVIINNNLADIKHIFTPTENAITNAMKRSKKQGVSTVLLEVVTPDLTIEFVESVVRNQLGSQIKEAIVILGGNVYSIK